MSGSKSTTFPSYALPTPPTRTLGSSMPATTWALVITCSVAYTKPLPSRPWVPATPSIFTVLRLAAPVAAAVTLSPEGLATSAVASFSNGLKTWGKPASVSADVASENQAGVVSGMLFCTAPSSTELRIALVTTADEEAPRTLAATHATMSTAIVLAAAPPMPSATRRGLRSISRRSRSASQARQFVTDHPRHQHRQHRRDGRRRGARLHQLHHPGQHPDACRRAAHETGEGHTSRYQAATVTRRRVGQDHQHQQDVEHVHSSRLSLGTQ